MELDVNNQPEQLRQESDYSYQVCATCKLKRISDFDTKQEGCASASEGSKIHGASNLQKRSRTHTISWSS